MRPAAREIASAAELSPLMSAIGRQLLSKLTSERDSVVSTEPNVENQRIDLLLDQEAGHAHAVRSLEYPMSLQLEQGREERAKAVVVLGGQNRRSFLRCHGLSTMERAGGARPILIGASGVVEVERVAEPQPIPAVGGPSSPRCLPSLRTVVKGLRILASEAAAGADW